MNNDKKIPNVPNLRFPEFAEEWKKIKIKDFGTVVTGNTPPTKNIDNYGDDYLWASPGDLGLSKYVTDTKTKLSEKGFQATRKISKGSVLVTCIGIVGKMGMAAQIMATNQQINSIIVAGDFDSDFVYYAIGSRISKYQSFVSQQVVPIISKSVFEELENYKTSNREQKKIGLFLSLLDDRISTQSQIIKELETLIRGLIFSFVRKKETNALLKDCLSCHSSILMENAVAGKSGEYPVYGAAGIIAHTPGFEIDDDAILIIKDGASVGKVQYAPGKYSAIGTLNYLRPKGKVSLKYFYYYLQALNFDKYKVGSGIPHIYFKDYGSEPVYCPPIETQIKIADCLSAIDAKLETERQILKAYTEQKKYLLANMFI